MASHQPFGSRSYAGGKLPDRSINANAMPFSASSFSRPRGLGATTTTAAGGIGSGPGDFAADAGPKSTQTAPAGGQAGPAPDTNPLNRLTEEQREEINEAV